MPTRVLLEGPEIEPLLAQVRQEYGTAARIISADKVRSGGLGGFFAKQRYELSVEIDDEIHNGADNGTDNGTDVPIVRPIAATPAALPAAPAAPAGEPVDGLLALVEASQDRYRDLPVPPPPADPVRPVPTTPPTTAAPPRSAAAPTTPATPVTPAAPTTAAEFAATVTPRAGLVSTANPGFAEVLAGLRGGLNTATAAGSAVEVATAVRPYQPPTVTSSEVAPLAAELVALGLPEPLARRATDADPYQAVVKAFAALPAPPAPPSRPGDVLIIAGELAHALPIGRQVATDLHLDPTKILLAAASTAGTGLHAARRVSGPVDAERRARRLHRADVPHVVVIDAPVGGTDDGWVREVCDALGATEVWAVVDATRKTTDTVRHLARLGQVDAVAVQGTAATGDPAAPLHLPQPVALLDGQPATPHAWASLLAERLQPAAQPARRPRRRNTRTEA